MLFDFRQGVVSGHTREAGNSNFLTSSGNHVSIVSSSVKLVLTIAHGQSNYMVTFPGSLPNFWTIPVQTKTWLLITINPTNARIEAKTTRYPPITSINRPVIEYDGQYWFDLNVFKMRVSVNNCWCETIGIVVGRWDGSSFVECSDFGTQVGYNTPTLAGSILYDDQGKPMKKASGEFFTNEDQMFGQSSVASSVQSSTITAVALTTIPKNTVVKLVEWGQIVPATSIDIGRYVIGFVRSDATVGSETQVMLTGKISSRVWSWSNPNDLVWVTDTGQISDIRRTSSMRTFRALPVGRVVESDTIYFAPPLTENVGEQGVPGPIGPQGAQGSRGERGVSGPVGETGPIGSIGLIGDMGPTGPIGPVGPVGLQGVRGNQGIQGERGDKGIGGDVGPQGSRGLQGERGIKGDRGDPGPQGIKGDPGPMGPIGRTGPIGLQGFDGVAGLQGMSAYEVAVQQGFVGNVAEWVVSLSHANSTTTQQTRISISGTTNSIAPSASEVITVVGYNCYTLLRVTASSPAYIRIYYSANAAIIGNQLPIPTTKSDSDGLIWQGDLTNLVTQLTPAIIGYNNESSDSVTMYVSVTNKSGVSKRVTVGMTVIKIE